VTGEMAPHDVLAWSEGRLDELEGLLHAATDAQDRCWLAVQLARESLDQYEYQSACAEVLGEPDVAILASVLACATIVEATWPDGDAFTAIRLPLGMAHTYLYWQTDDDDERHLGAALEHLPMAIELIDDPTDRARRWSAVARLLLARSGSGSPHPDADLRRAIQLLGLVLSTPEVADLHDESTYWRAQALFELCEETVGTDPELPALTAMALAALADAAALTEEAAVESAGRAGRLLFRRHVLELSPIGAADLDDAIQSLLTAVAQGAESTPEPAAVLWLGRSLSLRFDEHQRPEDRDAGILWLGRAAEQTDFDLDDVADCRQQRGQLLLYRFESTREKADLEAAVRDLTAARDALEPGTDTRWLAVCDLAEALAHRAGDVPAPSDVIQQVECLRELLDGVPASDSDRVYAVLKLALMIFEQTRGLQRWLPELDELVAELTVALPNVPTDNEYRFVIEGALGILHGLRFATLGLESRHDPADAATAIQLLERSLANPLSEDGFQYSVHALLGTIRWLRAIADQGWSPHLALTEWNAQFSASGLVTSQDFRRAIEHFGALRALDPTAPQPSIVIFAETLDALRDGVEALPEHRLGELIEQLKSVDRAEAGLSYPSLAALRGCILVELAGRTRRAQDVDRAVADLRALAGDLLPGDPIRNLVQDALGRALNLIDKPEQPGTAGQDPIADLQREVAAGGSYVPTRDTAARLVALADAHHQRGEAGRAIEVGRRALAEFAQAVLVSDDPEVTMETARAGNQHVGRLAHWCLERGEPTAAVDVLESGRGLILHATTLSIGLPELLRRSGHAALAAAWVAGSADPRVRADAVAALYRSPAGMRLLSPPSNDELGKVVWAAEIDSLVYLMAGHNGPGAALLVKASGAVEHLSLPDLRLEDGGPVASCRAAHRAAFLDRSMADLDADPGADPAIGHWHESLNRVSEWAYDVAIGPLLAQVRGWGRDRLPRLSLVPTGPLAAVAWHAARRRVAGELRYACQDAVLSYAASARQLADATGRRRLPLASAPVFVANPSGGQIWASMSAVGARSAFYPDAGYLGFPTTVPGRLPGTPEQVLAHLPSAERDGASMLQLSSHASVQDSSTRSYFELAQGRRLAVSEMLAHSHGRRPDAPGGLVICDSCMTDLSEQDHDEVLTLGTAFLAAGAVSVIGARWPIDDRTAAVMTFALHHQLALGLPPAEALHQTQLWMLDRSRPIPPGMPLLLAAEAKRPELTDLAAWAGLTHQGQ
jgi:hypothetical protein